MRLLKRFCLFVLFLMTICTLLISGMEITFRDSGNYYWIDLQQYEMLGRCSKEGDISEWNDWFEDQIGSDGELKTEINLRGASFSASTLSLVDLRSADLIGASFNRAGVDGADFRFADLRGASFWHAGTEETDFSFADMRGADLFEIFSDEASFRSADLRGADLRSADLRSTDFRGADLRGTDMAGADIQGADFRGAIFGKEKWKGNSSESIANMTASLD